MQVLNESKVFYVAGGEYKDTSFTEVIPGKYEKHGPFKTFEEAKEVWARCSWLNVDNAHYRYVIEEAVDN